MKYVIYIPEESDTTGFKHYGNENSGRHKRGSGKDPFQALKRAHIIPWGENFRKKAEDVKNAVGQRVEKIAQERDERNTRKQMAEKVYDEMVTALYRASDKDREEMVKNVRLKQLAAVLVTGNDGVNKGKVAFGPTTKSAVEQRGTLINYINHPDKDPVNQRVMKVNEASRNGGRYKMTPKEIREDREFVKMAVTADYADKVFGLISLGLTRPNVSQGAIEMLTDKVANAARTVREIEDKSETLDRIPKPTLLDTMKENAAKFSEAHPNATGTPYGIGDKPYIQPHHRQNDTSKAKLDDIDPRDLKVIHPANTVRGKIQRTFDKDVKEALSDKPANRQNSTSKTKSEDVKVTYDKMQQAYERQKAMFKYADEMQNKIDKDYEKVRSTLSNNPNVNMMYPVSIDRAKTDGKPIIYLDSDYLKSDADYNAAAKEWEKLGYYVEKL